MDAFIDISALPTHDMISGFQARFIHSESMTISYWDVKKGSKLPEHRHHHEQISQVIEGKFELTIDGKSMVMEPGKAAIIPSNIPHSGVAFTDCKVMDIFSPVREDYKIE